MKVIKHYKGCLFNKGKSGLASYALGEVYEYATEKTLDGAHNSLEDAKAQKVIFLDQRFQTYFNKKVSIQSMDEVISKKQENELRTENEQYRNVPDGWVEEETEWEPTTYTNKYRGPNGGGKYGPRSAMWDIARACGASLVPLFLFYSQ